MNRDMLERRLIKKDFEVITAEDGETATKMGEDYDPDLILMDIRLPDINGLDVTRQLKSSDSTKSIPIIALTAHATSDDHIKALEAGCDDYDTKPVRFNSLLEKINKFI